ncbi:MAG: hypothetical protein A2Y62_06940 [Candidatus Fischerbacteria bacterium RBG_13_37_8]|uniref:TonB C-terminal domain-containing protein n=1 Tax=Candidatus Fischerbacteria bacterium RBG_13_37_8 TaxID=1817863 RepID=A0A1F5VMF8_9BACT|nr:MAG: hypothetical protein A2Y62_06940 [Candidatus Fischerbacteria bacterium RBG_13_37_8]
MNETITKISKLNMTGNFIESRTAGFDRSRYTLLPIVITVHALLLAVLLVSSVWSIQYIDEPPAISEIRIDNVFYTSGTNQQEGPDSPIKKTTEHQIVNVPPDHIPNYTLDTTTDQDSPPIDVEPIIGYLNVGGDGPYLPDAPPNKGNSLPQPPKPNDGPQWIPAKGVQPKIIYRVQPEYPTVALLPRIQGEVVLEAIINTKGTVESVRIVKSLHPILDKAAMKALDKWRFEPGKVNGRPVKAYFLLTIHFKIV